MMSYLFFNQEKSTEYIVLKNGSTVSSDISEIIMNALRLLMKTDYEQYDLLVEFCRTVDLPNYLTKLKKMLWIEHVSVNQDDIVNVVCSAVDNDMVIGSPLPSEPRTMYAGR